MHLRASRTVLLTLALTCALACTALADTPADVPASPEEAFERVIARFAGGDAKGAYELLVGDEEQGLVTTHGAIDVILATAGNAEAAKRLLRAGWRAKQGRSWLLLAAARGLAKDHPVLATSLASTLLAETPSGWAARRFMVRTMNRAGAPKLAAKTLSEGFGDLSRRLHGIPRRVLEKLPVKRVPAYETERAWMWLDLGEHDRATAIFERAMARSKIPDEIRCWATAGAARAALHTGRREAGWTLLLESFERCPQLPMVEDNDVFLARMAFGRGARDVLERALARIASRGADRLKRHGLDVLKILPQSKGGLLFLTRALRERYTGWPFRDALTPIAVDLWKNYDKRRKHKLAIEMLQPLLDAGYVARRERARGELATCLARSYRRAGRRQLAQKTLIHAAYHHPLNWYGILALEELRKLDPFIALATEHTVMPAYQGPALDPQWDASPEMENLRDKLTVLASYGLAEGVVLEAQAAHVERHAGRAAWVARLLGTLGAPREASKLAHKALEAHGVHSPLDGLIELWRLAYPRPFEEAVERHAHKNGVDPRLTWAVMRIESRYATTAQSHAGARGLLQVMPKTAEWLASLRREKGSIDLFDPLRNIELASDLLGRLHHKFSGEVPLMLAAYNAGAGRTRSWQRTVRAKTIGRWIERLPIAQARNYVRSVVSAWALYRYLDGSAIGLAPDEATDEATKAVAQNL